MSKGKGILRNSNDDNLCLIRAIVLGLKWIEKKKSIIDAKMWRKISRNTYGIQDMITLDIACKAGIDVAEPTRNLGVIDLKKLKYYMKI